jgi:hypothetical protein
MNPGAIAGLHLQALVRSRGFLNYFLRRQGRRHHE